MNTELDKEEIKIKISEDSSNGQGLDIVFANPVVENHDFSMLSRKLRLVLNKVTEDNFEKLVIDLVTGFEYTYKLLKELTKLIFDRATSRNFSDLYSRLCSYFYIRVKAHSHETYTIFKKCLNEKCETILTISDQSIVPLCKFIALLYNQNLIKGTIISQYLDLIAIEKPPEHILEAGCHLLKLSSSQLVPAYHNKLEKIILHLSTLSCESYPKRIQFLVMDIVENKASLLTPSVTPVASNGCPFKTSAKSTGKGVTFVGPCSDFQPVQSRQTKRILKQNVSEEVKSALKEAVSEFMGGKTSLDTCKQIFKNNRNKERQLINQIFKYALYQYNKDQEFVKICEMILKISEDIDKKEAIETGLTYTVEAIKDIKLDSPMASDHLVFMIQNLYKIGAIENTSYLFDHLNNI
jgi:MIF4G domain